MEKSLTLRELECKRRFIFNINIKNFMKRDNQVFDLIEQEKQRQLHGIELIASENFVSDEVMQAMGSVLTNKYAEGYPGARYYGGCQVVDKVEQLAIDRVCELYGAGTRRPPLARFARQHVRHPLQGRRLSGRPGDRHH